jgi:hypothetical protein
MSKEVSGIQGQGAEIIVRDATVNDRDFVINAARRLASFELPPWRTANEIVTREQKALQDFFPERRFSFARFLRFLLLPNRPKGHFREFLRKRSLEGYSTCPQKLSLFLL